LRAKDKFIAFVDILGFTALVEAAEQDGGGDFSRPIELAQALGSVADANKFRTTARQSALTLGTSRATSISRLPRFLTV
jgi:hypothetical protein